MRTFTHRVKIRVEEFQFQFLSLEEFRVAAYSHSVGATQCFENIIYKSWRSHDIYTMNERKYDHRSYLSNFPRGYSFPSLLQKDRITISVGRVRPWTSRSDYYLSSKSGGVKLKESGGGAENSGGKKNRARVWEGINRRVRARSRAISFIRAKGRVRNWKRKREGREKEEVQRTKLKRGPFPGEKHTRTIASLCTSL